LDADDHGGGDIGIAANARQGAEGQLEVFAKLKPPVSVGQGHGALNQRGDTFGGRVGDVIHRQNDDVIADAVAAIGAAKAGEFKILGCNHTLHLRVLTLWTWTCAPRATGLTALPTGRPYLITCLSLGRSRMATLWPRGTLSRNRTLPARFPSSVTAPMVEPFL